VVLRKAMAVARSEAELSTGRRAGAAVEGTVTAVNKGGVEVTVAGYGILPTRSSTRATCRRREYVGRKLQFGHPLRLGSPAG